MFDPSYPADVKRLRRACRQSREELKHAREVYVTSLRELAGPRYTGGQRARYMNVVELATTTYRQNLFAARPQLNVVARSPGLAPGAYSFELAVNKVLDQQDAQTELEMWGTVAMFAPFGMLKISLDAGNEVEVEGQTIVTGLPSMKAAMFNDTLFDMTANSPTTASYMGDRYQLTVVEALNMGFPEESVVQLWRKYEDDQREKDDPQKLSRSQRRLREENYEDLIEVWDVWLPREKVVVTFGGDFDETPPLKVVQWTGPKNGPYHLLWFDAVPGNALPSPPSWLWLDIHELLNKLWFKLGDQAERQKSVGIVETKNHRDGETMRDSSDGDMLTLNQMASVGKVSSGGIDPQNLIFAQSLRQVFNSQSGNVDLMGGQSPMSATVGQDQLLSAAASKRLQRMQSKVYEATRKALKDYGWYVWTDPLLRIPVTKKVPETTLTIPGEWSADEMAGDYDYDYDVDIQPFSMQQRSPEERLREAREYWRNDVLPALPILQAQGILPSFEAYAKLIADFLNQPELATLVTYTQGEMQPSAESARPANTTRTYERVSRSARTGRGQDVAMMDALASMSRDNNSQSMEALR